MVRAIRCCYDTPSVMLINNRHRSRLLPWPCSGSLLPPSATASGTFR